LNGPARNHPHKEKALKELFFKILTVSSTRGLDEDTSGDLIQGLVQEWGYQVQERRTAVDDIDSIRQSVRDMLKSNPHVLIIDGGTGVTPKDVTVEAVQPLLEKEMAGFSTLFTQLSFEQIGPAAVLSRAFAGVRGETAIFCIPGSSKACSLALKKIILPEAAHITAHVRGRA